MSLIITECGWLDARHQDVSLQIVCEPQKLHVSLPLRAWPFCTQILLLL